MRLSVGILVTLAACIAVSGCRSAPPKESSETPATPQPVVTKAPAAEMTPSPAVTTSAPKATQPKASPKVLSTHTESAQDIAQLDLDQEGGVKDGSYVMWVHVTERGKPVLNLPVRAYKVGNTLAAAARTNDEGDAMLKVQAATYRVTADRGARHAEQTVTYHPGDQFELDLRP